MKTDNLADGLPIHVARRTVGLGGLVGGAMTVLDYIRDD